MSDATLPTGPPRATPTGPPTGPPANPAAGPPTGPPAAAPVGQPAPPARNPLPLILVGVGLAVAAIVVIVVLAVGGGSSGSRPAGASGAPGSSVVHLNVPPGWTLSSDGLVTAQNSADLTAPVPTGPRVRAQVGDVPDSAADLMATALDQPAATLTGGPNTTTVSGQSAIGVAITANGLTQGYIVVHPQGKPAVLFILEAPAASFSALTNQLLAVPGLR